ncbi:HlyD family secretion protein [Beijerinckia sp. L45]|uniref:efflux RND transporter periplasmic adaptor subunit n=1 Tax=Beijerinckia sp. L45 TaxID=1641855 RepID=UPI00131CABFD|nr:HlyD family secretion protein [Beijerinckia sp. L45]
MFKRARRFIRFLVTGLILVAACVAIVGLWLHYMVAPWTRDGEVRVQVANIAPQVPGPIVDLRVADNQFVHKDDLLYVIDKADYQVALDSAEADVASKKADLDVKQNQAARREALTTLSTSVEEKQTYVGASEVAKAAYQGSLASLERAKLNLSRTEVRSTVNGYVTNLLLRRGDYANTGTANIAIIDSDSFWVSGYFEETKMGSFSVGDPASVELMGYNGRITGHVDSIGRGISTSNATVSTQGLPSVQAVYTWVRLAQRVPVRIAIDRVPDGIILSAGMTATVVVSPPNHDQGNVWTRVSDRFEGLWLKR